VHRVTGGWWSGLEIQQLIIAESATPQAPPLVQVERLVVNRALLPLFLSTRPVALHVDSVDVYLRQQPDGRWNLAPLLHALTGTSSSTPTLSPFSSNRQVELAVTDGRLSLGQNGSVYRFAVQAESASLVAAPLQWQVTLAGPQEAALTAQGHMQNLLGPGALTGQAEVQVTQLDLALLAAFVPATGAGQPQGYIQTAQVRLGLTAAHELAIDANLEAHAVGWRDMDRAAAETLASIQVQLQGRQQGPHWTCETLSVVVPDGHFALRDPAWLQIDATDWRGHVGFTLDVQDMHPITQALAVLLPAPLQISGRLQAAGDIDGAISRESEQTWEARLAGLHGAFEGHVTHIQWDQESLTDINTKLRLQEKVLTVTQATANVAGGTVDLHGQLAIAAETPTGTLEWQLTNLSLHPLLGKPIQRFVLAQASGHITHDDKGYHIQSTARVPEFALLPTEIDDRELRLTRVAFDCTATTLPPFTQLTLGSCTVQAPEAHLTLHQGKVALGAQPQLTTEVDGWLAGPFVNALVPETPTPFPEPLFVHGPLTVPLYGKVWREMQWQLAVKSQRFLFEEMAFTDLQATVVKAPQQLDITDLQSTRETGHVQGSGSWRLAGPAAGNMHLQAEQVPLQRVLRRDAAGQQYIVEGAVSGPVQLLTGKDGVQHTGEYQVTDLRLRRDALTLAQMPAARIAGTFGREPNGTWWARQLELLGEALTLSIREGRLPTRPVDTAGFQVEATLAAEGQWLTAFLAMYGLEELVLSGRTEAMLQLQGHPDNVLKTLQGQGSVQASGVSFHGQPFTAVDLVYEIVPGQLRITHGALGYKGGTLLVQGSLGLPLARSTPGDQLLLTLHQFPLSYSQELSSFRGQGPATLSTQTVLDGQVTLRSSESSQLTGVLDVQTARITRQIHSQEQRLAEVALPSLHLIGEATTVRPDEHWDITTLRLDGDGLSIDIKEVSVRRTSAHYDIAGQFTLQAAAQVAEGLTLGLFPETVELTGAVELTGTAGLRVPLDGAIQPQDVLYAGKLGVERLQVEDEDLESLTAQLQVEQGRITVTEGGTALLGGRVWLGSPSFIALQGPSYDFSLNVMAEQLQLRVHSGKRISLRRVLSLLLPVFIFEYSQDKPVKISGRLDGNLQLAGRYTATPGWSRSVNGQGYFRIEEGEVRGSTIIYGFFFKALFLPQNIVHNALKELFSRDGKLGQTLLSLGDREFVFGKLESPLQVQAGVIQLQKDLTITSPELSLVVNGHSTLEGEVDYHIRSDLIYRLRFGEITSLPDKIPLLGEALQYINPFNVLEGLELEATVQGNVFQTDASGRPAVHVDTSIMR
jgi:hypothetical protein